ncbi:translocase of inner mitochondrial membrane 21, transcript variant X2 [Ictidomys tridecemlineatus]|nr:translocase of inner mitochondrial membrane 21, transcript variant X2 [Ictidomys tridecemlineatus]
MICTALRALQYAERLHRSSGKRLLLPDRGPHRAASKTQPSLRWGLREPKKTAQPRSVLGLVQKTIWTQGPSPCNAQEDRRKQVSVHRDQRAETAVSTSQKVKEAGRDFTYLVIVVIGVGITGGQRLRGARERLRGDDAPRAEAARQLHRVRERRAEAPARQVLHRGLGAGQAGDGVRRSAAEPGGWRLRVSVRVRGGGLLPSKDHRDRGQPRPRGLSRQPAPSEGTAHSRPRRNRAPTA